MRSPDGSRNIQGAAKNIPGQKLQFLRILARYVTTIRYDSVYLTCSKKLTGSQLRPPHGTNKKLKCETKNKMKLNFLDY